MYRANYDCVDVVSFFQDDEVSVSLVVIDIAHKLKRAYDGQFGDGDSHDNGLAYGCKFDFFSSWK
jgi:hypothetical protein